MAKQAIPPGLSDMFEPGGQHLLDEMPLDQTHAVRVESLRDLIEIYDREVAMLEREIQTWLRDDAGYSAIQALDGVGKTMAAIFAAEIGDVSRFAGRDKLCSWAGLTPGGLTCSGADACGHALSVRAGRGSAVSVIGQLGISR